MIHEFCRVTQNTRVAPGHYRMTLESARIARDARPGQFVQVLCDSDPVRAHRDAPLLPRPFSFLDASGRTFSILYHVVGRGTALLERVRAGESLKILGPLGNGFAMPDKRGHKAHGTRHKEETAKVVLVGGGVGIPPLLHLAKALIAQKRLTPKQIRVLLGARDKSLLLCEKEFKKLGVDFQAATDNGSKGHKGFVTELLQKALGSHPAQIYTCGPTAMMRAVSRLAVEAGVPCQVSVEVPMACGFGACLGCAIKIRQETRDPRPETPEGSDKSKAPASRSLDTGLQSPVSSLESGFRYAIACCEGPVFDGSAIVWDA